jgi:hypothetical protein
MTVDKNVRRGRMWSFTLRANLVRRRTASDGASDGGWRVMEGGE